MVGSKVMQFLNKISVDKKVAISLFCCVHENGWGNLPETLHVKKNWLLMMWEEDVVMVNQQELILKG